MKWFAKFTAGDFLLDNAPWLGRPGEDESNRIETLIENNQCYTTWERANILKISKSITVISENEKAAFYFMENTIRTFWPTQYF